jgi:hypothetical protein
MTSLVNSWRIASPRPPDDTPSALGRRSRQNRRSHRRHDGLAIAHVPSARPSRQEANLAPVFTPGWRASPETAAILDRSPRSTHVVASFDAARRVPRAPDDRPAPAVARSCIPVETSPSHLIGAPGQGPARLREPISTTPGTDLSEVTRTGRSTSARFGRPQGGPALTAVTINLRHRTSHLAASRSAGMGSG